jgi:hypothetical protein
MGLSTRQSAGMRRVARPRLEESRRWTSPNPHAAPRTLTRGEGQANSLAPCLDDAERAASAGGPTLSGRQPGRALFEEPLPEVEPESYSGGFVRAFWRGAEVGVRL